MILSFGSTAEGAAFPWALAVPALAALVAYAVAAMLPQQGDRAVRASLVIAWLAHAGSIAIDTTGLGSDETGARFGFAPALSVTLWLVIGVYLVESRLLPLTGVRRALALLGAVAVALAAMFPGEHPQVDSRWEPLHWVTGIATYGLFGVAVLHAAMLNRADRQMRQPPQHSSASPAALGLPLLHLERLTFRFVMAGFVVLTATLVLGWWFANPWQWDHKKVFSILAWVVFAALLAGRRAFGWRGPVATRWLYAGTGLLLLAYVGSRFVFEVVLHRPPVA
ncbi:cytochrome C assembly family protein [Piscinibacter sp.]|uniref:cytochrome C assembly family protein n=1 Tax=Piscinibacter sp. TaxID=1903157 RepID=UPI002B9A0C8C|nr:cytochrome c biogenesis protein CcsA [Albitalea sp.]HUG24601.1 cytochrome c biogenesis protein CcsA [Albitalea sp.]